MHWLAAQASEAAQTRRQHLQSHSGHLEQSMLLQQQLTRLWLCNTFSTKTHGLKIKVWVVFRLGKGGAVT